MPDRWRLARALCGLVAAMLASAATARAQPAARTAAPEEGTEASSAETPEGDETEREIPAAERPPRPLGITVSGGSSLGAYEAGYLYYLIESLRSVSSRMAPRTFTGTSAGSINAFIALVSYCTESIERPTESLFYQTWIPTGIESLYDRREVTPNAIFTRTAFVAASERIRARFDGGLRDGCEALLGTTVTRVRPQMVPMAHQQLSLPRMTERFLLRVEGRGRGRAPLVENHRPASTRTLEMPLLPFDGRDAPPFDAIRDVLFASSGFPLAFPPLRVAYCSSSRALDGRCTPARAEHDAFVDGGVFTSVPLDLTALSLREPDEDGEMRLADDALFLTVSPTPRAYPVLEPVDEDSETPTDLIPFVLTMLEGFVETTLSLALSDFIASHPEVDQRMFVSRANHPPISDLVGAFAGLFERDFRRFDFYLGMTDAHRLLRDLESIPALERDLTALTMLEDRVDHDAPGWRPYFCLRAALDGDGDVRERCRGEALATTRALAAVSVERVYDACRASQVGDDPHRRALAESHADCRRALAGHPPPAMFGHRVGDWQRPDDNELLWVFRRLAHHGFTFSDLRAESGDDAYHALRDRLAQMARRLADRQGELSPLLRAGVQSAMDSIAYRPEAHIVYFDLGGSLMLGWSATTTFAPWFRGVTALEVRGITTLISSEPDWFAVTPLLGIELEPTPLSSGILQGRLGLRVGYMFSSGDAYLVDGCGAPMDTARPCSRPVLQATLAITLVHLVRISVTGEWAPRVRPGEEDLFGLRPHAGLQLIFD